MPKSPAHIMLDEYIQLLDERGYLSSDFKPGSQIGYWVKELQELFEQAYKTSMLNGKPTRFSIDTYGTFHGLDRVHCNFRFTYRPDRDTLSLDSLYTKMHIYSHTCELDHSSELPAAGDMYLFLYEKGKETNNVSTLVQHFTDYLRDKDPAHDYDPHAEPLDYHLDSEADPYYQHNQKEMRKQYLAVKDTIRHRARRPKL